MSAVLDFTRPHVLRTEAEYKAAVTEIDNLLDRNAEEGTEEYDLLVFLSVLVEAYESEHEPDGDWNPSPQEAVQFLLEQKGMTRSDLTNAMGGRSRVSEFFTGKRELSKEQIRALRDLLGVSADLFI